MTAMVAKQPVKASFFMKWLLPLLAQNARSSHSKTDEDSTQNRGGMTKCSF